jgi:ribosomal protein S18 acetylase RimI-like enzyme
VTTVRPYRRDDEQGWLRCRVLAFLATAYFDDVVTKKPLVERGIQLVAATDDDLIAGILDASVDGDLATVDTIAVHPDHQSRGIGTALLQAAKEHVKAQGATTLDAWTRDDEPTLRWYRAMGFTESDHYLHVYADHYVDRDEPRRAVESKPGLDPIKVFLHGRLEDEEEMRQQFRRVHVCRRFSMPL